MEYCQRSLKQEIMDIGAGKMKPYTLEELWDFIRSMASVLSKMQKMNILHRDIKPENILIKIEGNSKRKWKLCDFAFSTVKN
jgi:serine/threonine protein kinase